MERLRERELRHRSALACLLAVVLLQLLPICCGQNRDALSPASGNSCRPPVDCGLWFRRSSKKRSLRTSERAFTGASHADDALDPSVGAGPTYIDT